MSRAGSVVVISSAGFGVLDSATGYHRFNA
jgi:hypothetical protein